MLDDRLENRADVVRIGNAKLGAGLEDPGVSANEHCDGRGLSQSQRAKCVLVRSVVAGAEERCARLERV